MRLRRFPQGDIHMKNGRLRMRPSAKNQVWKCVHAPNAIIQRSKRSKRSIMFTRNISTYSPNPAVKRDYKQGIACSADMKSSEASPNYYTPLEHGAQPSTLIVTTTAFKEDSALYVDRQRRVKPSHAIILIRDGVPLKWYSQQLVIEKGKKKDDA